MRSLLMILAVLSVSAICFSATAKDKLVPGSQVTREVKVKSGGKEVNMRYWQFVPKGYNGKKNLPLMLFLHGAGERGDNLEVVKKWGPPKLVRKRKDFPFVVISPQCPRGTWWKVEGLY